MEDYAKNPTTWNKHYLKTPRSKEYNGISNPFSSNISTSDANCSFSYLHDGRKKGSEDLENNPLKMSFTYDNYDNNGTKTVPTSENSHFHDHNEAPWNIGPNHGHTDSVYQKEKDNYSVMLYRIRPSLDLTNTPKNFVNNAQTQKVNDPINFSPSNKKNPHMRSLLIKNKDSFNKSKKQKKVRFDDKVDVIEVENWKIYNVDVASQPQNEYMIGNKKICAIF